MKITMDKKWALRESPTEEVRVLCTDAHGEWPVVILSNNNGFPTQRSAEGVSQYNDRDYDLVPLRMPREWWVSVKTNGTGFAYQTEGEIVNFRDADIEVIHVREVLEDD